jgi:hypothetical protein
MYKTIRQSYCLGGALLIALFTLIACPSPDQLPEFETTIPGGNIVNQTWSSAGSPYFVQGDITIPSGTTLAIEEGTVVKFADTDSMSSGESTNRIEVVVNGTLTVQGSASSPVIFQALSGTNPHIWYGIVVADAGATVTVDHARIEHAFRGIYCQTSGLLTVSSTDIANCDCGIYTEAGSPSIDAVTIWGTVDYGLYFYGQIDCSITNAVIRDNTGYGIYAFEQTSGGWLYIKNCTINSNGNKGIHLYSLGTFTASLMNNIITNNDYYGVYAFGSGMTMTATASYCDYWNNTLNWSGVMTDNCISTNPLYAGAPTDLSLGPTSPCVDTGSDTGAPDHDRNMVSRPQNGSGVGDYFDMGAYELSP